MRIKKIVIQNFRSIKGNPEDDSKFEIEPDKFNIFVGQNNHGKTNVFEAIDWFFNNFPRGISEKDIVFNNDLDRAIIVQVLFKNIQSGLNAMTNEKHKTHLKKSFAEHDELWIQRSSKEKKLKISFDGKIWSDPQTGFDAAFKNFLPNFEYITTKKYFDDVGKYERTSPIGIMLSSVLEAIIEDDQDYQQLKERFYKLFEGEDSKVKVSLDQVSGSVKLYLEKQFPDCTKVRFEVSPPQFNEFLKNFETWVNDGIETKVSDKGDGLQRALMLSIIQTYADWRKAHEEKGKTFLFFIDEAELHLHPTAQRHLKNALYEVSQSGDQVFINTHSSVLITDEYDSQRIFKIQKNEQITRADEVTKEEKQNVVYDLLGGSPTDLLLPANFLIVEGKAEFSFINSVIQRFYKNKPNIKIVSGDGDYTQVGRSANAIKKLYDPLTPVYEDRLVVLVDKKNNDNLRAYTDFAEKYEKLAADRRLKILPKDNLEDYYPSGYFDKKFGTICGTTKLTDKTKLAERIGKHITQQDFEKDMDVIYEALEKCWEGAFGQNNASASESKEAA